MNEKYRFVIKTSLIGVAAILLVLCIVFMAATGYIPLPQEDEIPTGVEEQ